MKEKDRKNFPSHHMGEKVENGFGSPIEQRIAPFCTPSSLDDERGVIATVPSRLIALAWQFDFAKSGPKLEGGHLNFRGHFEEDK